MKGVGRKFDEASCREQLAGVNGLILGNTAEFPKIEFAILQIPQDLELVTFTRSDAKVSLINWMKLRKRK
jgi:hypothetical protein